jgi:polyhydroxyalkanoate synthesis regulator phasin
MKMVLAAVLIAVTLAPMAAGAQIPSVSSLIPDKAALLEQGKKIVADLLTLKQDPKLPAADRSKVDALLPKANAVNAELAKPQVETSKLTQLASQVTDLQKQVAAIKATVVR